jgi:hypothetical protein
MEAGSPRAERGIAQGEEVSMAKKGVRASVSVSRKARWR